ncbi:MAG: hypothetical protein AB2812_03790 [Candidatus Sedimenticola endophacoides]
MIEHMLAKTREEQSGYLKNVNDFQTSRKIFKQQSAKLRATVNLRRLEKAIDNTRNSMEGNWTTHGLKINIKCVATS